MYKRLSILTIITITMIFLSSCNNYVQEDDRLKVIVSIVPQEGIVHAIAGEYVNVSVLIPPGSNPATYQPTPRQMTAFTDASIYFTMDVPTELSFILPNLSSMTDNINIVDLADIVDETYAPRFFIDLTDDEAKSHDGHGHEGRDPHMWLSPKRTMLMAEIICEELSKLDPAHKDIYNANLEIFIEEVHKLDEDIMATLSQLQNKSFIIMHPSLGYFADDYGLDMIAIEQDGKETTAKRLQSVIDFANDNHIKVIFYQAEFDSQQAETLAQEIDGIILEVTPLAHDYIENMNRILDAFKE